MCTFLVSSHRNFRISLILVSLNERRVFGILIGETEREFSDDGTSDGETNEKRPVTVPFSLEKHWPRIEFPHLFRLLVFYLSPSLCHTET